MKREARLILVTLSVLILLPHSGYSLLAFMDMDVYGVNDTAVIKINRTQDVNITGVVAYLSNSTQADNFTIASDGTTGMVEYAYPQTLQPDEYTLTLTQGSDSVGINFRIASEILRPVVRLMGSAEPVFINTSTEINSDSGGIGGNFSRLLEFNKTPTIFYGYVGNLTGDGRSYHFVAVDEKAPGVYDRVYIDDDKHFRMFNDTEDNSSVPFLETLRGPGDMLKVDSTHSYIIADMESATGKMVYMIRPPDSPTFSSSDTLYILILLFDPDGNVQKNRAVNLSIASGSGQFKYSQLALIGQQGYANVSVNLSGYSPGKYTVLVNETPADMFRVESFKLHGKVTDLSDNPLYTFAPGSKAKVWAVSRDSDGNLMSLDAVPSGTLMLPDGSTTTLSFAAVSGATGVYTAETSALALAGNYKVVITGTKSPDTERFDMGFRAESLQMMAMAINPKYIDEGAGPGTMVSAFPPGSNVTFAVLMINTTKGSSLGSGGPPCGFDGQACVPVSCSTSQFELTVRDDLGRKYKLTSGNFTSMTIKDAASLMGLEGPEEPGMDEQCMIIVLGDKNPWLANKGNYKAEIKFSNKSVGNLAGGETFSVERLLATGSTVDFKGDSFSFFAPNSTVRVKLEIRDMLTDELLAADKILNARFTEMWKEWPERKNALTEMAGFDKSKLNESTDGDKIVFISPPEEGFYMAEFRFSANVSGTIMEGTGNIFFELKKYMIWAQLQSVGEDSWFVKPGQNITLVVNIMDIDMGSQFGKGSTPTCTGCTGLIANISSLRNEQFFKEMKEGVDYTITAGVVVNSTSGSTIIIHPANLPTGWYGADVVLQRPGTDEQYYGWGWFEIRNFWVDVFEVEEDSGNYTRKEGNKGQGGATVPVGGETLLGVAAFSPPSSMSPPTPLKVSSVSLEGLQDDMTWPPIPVPASHYSVTGLGEENLTECFDGQCDKMPFYLVNFSTTGSIKESMYMLNLRVNAQGAGSDIGTADITVSSYVLDYVTVPMTKMFEWPPVYSNAENLTMIFTASDFEENPHNITNVTVDEFFSEKEGRPIKFRYGLNYTNNCTGSTPYCGIDVFLSDLYPGEYFVEFKVVDDSMSVQYEQYELQIKNIIFSVPRIYEGWTMDQSTPEKTIEAWNNEDRCGTETHGSYVFNPDIWGEPYNTTANINKVYIGSGGDNPPPAVNITIPENRTPSQSYQSWIFCVNLQEGSWFQLWNPNDPCWEPGDARVYVVGNNSGMAWINSTDGSEVGPGSYAVDLSASQKVQEGSAFGLKDAPGFIWKLAGVGGPSPNYLRVTHDNGIICSRNELGGDVVKVVTPPEHANYSEFYHGPSYIVGDMWQQGPPNEYSLQFMMEISDRPAYVYHNTTHLWLYPNSTYANFTDSSLSKGPVAVGSVIEDGYGGKWKIVSISKSRVKLKGQNTLDNGIMVNTSLSTSGKVWVGELRESDMGFENKMFEENQGLDLDGDGETNGTVFFLILDSGNGYDKLAFASDYSQKWNFTNSSAIIDVNDNDRLNRQVGAGSDTLTLLSIDPRASRVMFYDPSATGDWPELGDSRIGDNVTIPVIVKSPDGSPIAANVSLPNMKVKTEAGTSIVPTGLSPMEINGIGEIRVNVSSLGYESGRYEFEILANSTAYGVEKMNEWMWPRTTVRNFLVDTRSGYGGIITSFAPVDLDSYGGWWTNVKVRDLITINETSQPAITGVIDAINHDLAWPPSCPDFTPPDDVGQDSQNRTYVLDRLDNQYYAYMTPANQSMVWVKKGDCNFTGESPYSEGDPINITIGSEFYILQVLNTNMSAGTASVGIYGLPSLVKPIRMGEWGGNSAPMWAILSVNRSGTIYNVVFANESMPYPQANTWGIKDVSKAVWMDTDGNFTDSNKYIIGDNFTAGEYIAKVGPGPWEGVIIADSSNLAGLLGAGVRPGMDIRAMDYTPAYFGRINESQSGLEVDLNMDGDMQDLFYVVAYDDFEDSNQEITRFYVDDDLNISEPWWANSSNIQQGQTYTYYDFYGGEGGQIPEQEGSPPRGMWGGNLRFAPWNDSQSWEESAEWNIKTYNGTKMILEKDVWQLDGNRTISVTVKAFDFSQSPIPGAQVSLVKIMRFGGGLPFKELNESAGDFTLVNTQSVTDSKGYAMLKLVPPGAGWTDQAEYIAVLKVDSGGIIETVDQWFRVGQKEVEP